MKSEDKPKISRSKLDLFCQCPRCFWLDRKHKISQPSGAPFVLNNLVDELLKKEFNVYRAKQETPPFLRELGIDAVPFAHPCLEEWQNNRKGIRYVHEATNLCLYGAVDDVWKLPSGELVIVDYKAKATDKEITLEPKTKKSEEIVSTDYYLIGYKKQIEFYQWLFRKNGFKVVRTAYFVFANARKDMDVFDDHLEFKKVLIPYDGDDAWVEPTIEALARCLQSDQLPDPASGCAYCQYRAMARSMEALV